MPVSSPALRAAPVGYGAMALERLIDDPAAGHRVLRRALELGVDHIDTADFYGDGAVNDMIRRAVPYREDVLVVTKIGAVHHPGGPIPLRPAQKPEELRAAVEDNLRSLGRDRLDVVNLRRLDVGPGISAEGDQIVGLEDQLETMVALREEGLIGGFGLSAVGPDAVRKALPAGILCVQNAYSLVSREAEDVLELCISEGIAWVPFFPLGSGLPGAVRVTDQPEVRAAAARLGLSAAQIGLAWLLRHAPNTLLIPGTTNVDHLAENVASARVELDRTTMAELGGIWEVRRTQLTR